MKDENYITILGWMVNRLKLSGNELMVYAIIYGFCQDEESGYEGSANYIAKSLGISRRAVYTLLNNLLDKKLIIKYEEFANGIKYCDYKTNFDLLSDSSPKGGGAKTSQGMKKLHRVCKNFTGYEESSQGGMKNLPQGSEETSHHTTNINILDTTTTPNLFETDEKTPTVAEIVVEGHFLPNELKKSLVEIDKRLFFKSDFYQRAAAFMSIQGLDINYLSFVFDKCEKMKYNSLSGLYYTLFFEENVVEEFKESCVPDPAAVPKMIKCPVCGGEHGLGDDVCSFCGLRKYSNQEEINFHKLLYELPPDKREEYVQREFEIFKKHSKDFENLRPILNNLKKEYGLLAVS